MDKVALYSKQLHIRKAGVVSDINLYTTLNETGNSALAIKDGETTVYAKLGATTDALTSPLRVRKNGETRAVLTQAKPTYTEVAYTTPGTYTFTVPIGVTRIRVALCGGGGSILAPGGASSFGSLITAEGGKGNNLLATPNGYPGYLYSERGPNYGTDQSKSGAPFGFAVSFTNTKGSYGKGLISSSFNPAFGRFGGYGGSGAYDSNYFAVNLGDVYTIKVGTDPTGSLVSDTRGFVLVAYGGDV